VSQPCPDHPALSVIEVGILQPPKQPFVLADPDIEPEGVPGVPPVTVGRLVKPRIVNELQMEAVAHNAPDNRPFSGTCRPGLAPAS
jgi:hypothetical protein